MIKHLLNTFIIINLFGCQKETKPVIKQDISNQENKPIEMDYEKFKKHSLAHLQSLSDAHQKSWGFGEGEHWNADLKAGTIKWTFKDKIVTAPIQVICTYNKEKKKLLWGWDHPSVSEQLS